MAAITSIATDRGDVGYLVGAVVAYLDTQAAFGDRDSRTQLALDRLDCAYRPFVAQDSVSEGLPMVSGVP